jgi:hypothetical protein
MSFETNYLNIYGKKWYYRLIPSKKGEYKKSRALMDDYNLNMIIDHLVVCFTPDRLPGRKEEFKKKDGDPIRIYAFFDSYIEFYEFSKKFAMKERNFFEIIFGEFAQKPHFDIDIDLETFKKSYPGEDIISTAEKLKDLVIASCIKIIQEFSIEKDLLLYSSHGESKRSYHIVINNKCHDGNKEAKAFYDEVINFVKILTYNKYIEYIDKSVYSPRQQFRIVGSQKSGSDRPKIFHEYFRYEGKVYQHLYKEEFSNEIEKNLAIIYESLVGFTAGCSYIPSLIQPKSIDHLMFSESVSIDETTAEFCFNMLREKMNPCPFSLSDITGSLILLKRHSPSLCPICNRIHEKENPFMYILGGRVYWDCRRTDLESKKFFVGYLSLNHYDPNNSKSSSEEEDKGVFSFGDFEIEVPTKIFSVSDVVSKTTKIAQDWAREKSEKSKQKSIQSAKDELDW